VTADDAFHMPQDIPQSMPTPACQACLFALALQKYCSWKWATVGFDGAQPVALRLSGRCHLMSHRV
jgi:hypothetical protein